MAIIPQPTLPPLILQGRGKYRYLCTYKNEWNEEKQLSYRKAGETVSIGKFILLDKETGRGECIFYDKFIAEYPELEYFQVFRSRGGKLEFKLLNPDEDRKVIRNNVIVTLGGGATWALNQIVGSSPLARALHTTFGERQRDLRILSLAYFFVIEEHSILADYEDFAKRTLLPYARGRHPASLSRLLKDITRNDVARFLKALQRETQRLYGNTLCERQFWALDSTSITSYSEGIGTTAWGHNKDLIEAPQTNVLLIVDQQTGCPVYYRNFKGNTPDVSTIRNTIAELAMMGIDTSKVVLVSDRGYCSSGNWEDMMRNGISFVCSARKNLNAAIMEIIDENYHRLLDWNNHKDFIRQSAVTVPVEWKYDEFPVEGKRAQRKASQTLYIHLYRDKDIYDGHYADLRQAITDAITVYRTAPEKLSQAQQKLIELYTDKNDNGEVQISMKKVDAKLRLCGIRVLVSDVISDAVECHIAYEERNTVEEAFRTLKARLACDRTRVHSEEVWDGKLLVEIVALCIAQMVRARVKAYNDSAKAKGNIVVYRDSDGRLLRKLNNISVTQNRDGWIFSEVVGKEKWYFEILGLPVPEPQRTFKISDSQDDGDDEDYPLSDAEELGLADRPEVL